MQFRYTGIPLVIGVIFFGLVYAYVHHDAPRDASMRGTASVITTSKTATVAEPALPVAVGRLFIVGHWAHTPVASTTALIEEYGVGGVIIMSSPENPSDISDWTKEWQRAAEHPLMIAIDQEGGPVQRLRGPDFIATAQPDITTKHQAYAVANTRARELTTLGINTNFAPVVEHSISPDGFLYSRVFRNPADIAGLATAMLEGYRAGGVLGVIKHYPGHEDEPTDSHTDLPVIELTNTTFAEHTKDFNALFAAGVVPVIMTAHVLVPALDEEYPATLSKRILTEELREHQGYAGVIITDDLIMDAIDRQFSTDVASVIALNAGADLLLFAAEPEQVRTVIPYVLEAVADGTLSTTTIAEHYERVERLLK